MAFEVKPQSMGEALQQFADVEAVRAKTEEIQAGVQAGIPQRQAELISAQTQNQLAAAENNRAGVRVTQLQGDALQAEADKRRRDLEQYTRLNAALARVRNGQATQPAAPIPGVPDSAFVVPGARDAFNALSPAQLPNGRSNELSPAYISQAYAEMIADGVDPTVAQQWANGQLSDAVKIANDAAIARANGAKADEAHQSQTRTTAFTAVKLLDSKNPAGIARGMALARTLGIDLESTTATPEAISNAMRQLSVLAQQSKEWETEQKLKNDRTQTEAQAAAARASASAALQNAATNAAEGRARVGLLNAQAQQVRNEEARRAVTVEPGQVSALVRDAQGNIKVDPQVAKTLLTTQKAASDGSKLVREINTLTREKVLENSSQSGVGAAIASAQGFIGMGETWAANKRLEQFANAYLGFIDSPLMKGAPSEADARRALSVLNDPKAPLEVKKEAFRSLGQIANDQIAAHNNAVGMYDEASRQRFRGLGVVPVDNNPIRQRDEPRQDRPAAPAAPTGTPIIRSKEAFDALPSGTRFQDANGVLRTKP